MNKDLKFDLKKIKEKLKREGKYDEAAKGIMQLKGIYDEGLRKLEDERKSINKLKETYETKLEDEEIKKIIEFHIQQADYSTQGVKQEQNIEGRKAWDLLECGYTIRGWRFPENKFPNNDSKIFVEIGSMENLGKQDPRNKEAIMSKEKVEAELKLFLGKLMRKTLITLKLYLNNRRSIKNHSIVKTRLFKNKLELI
ncbi:hypothetical protein BpHYR1_029506 [Brachionus plicatilis]|uniref:Uncharacterized protein n=1 Tax=Brachionus plicatilis TaxID=10195 RepID=A0A3M7RQ16_BRAPC|nr:hypothetical protein BpHYR1_029506 [Brachionus plicatilis]